MNFLGLKIIHYRQYVTAMKRALLTQNGVNHDFSHLGNSYKLVFYIKRSLMSNLIDEVRNTLRVHHYAMKTGKSYVKWIRGFVLCHKKESMGLVVKCQSTLANGAENAACVAYPSSRARFMW